jgi:uncharacterized protein
MPIGSAFWSSLMSNSLREQQYSLARHLRDPSSPAPPGIEERRLRIYRELFFNNIERLLASGFPVIHDTLGMQQWDALVRKFYTSYRSSTPLFTQIATEFLSFLESYEQPDTPWLRELAHYEWVEQALFISDELLPPHDPVGDLLHGIPLLSPLALPLAYRWPVTDIGPTNVPQLQPSEVTTLLVHRDDDYQVHFARIGPLVYRLLTLMQESLKTGREHLSALAAEVGSDSVAMEAQALPLLEQLRMSGVVLGTAKAAQHQ